MKLTMKQKFCENIRYLLICSDM